MFNGIIKNTGKINKISRKKNDCVLEILSSIKFSKNEIGSSISCSGVCLTLENFKRNLIKFDKVFYVFYQNDLRNTYEVQLFDKSSMRTAIICLIQT